MDKILELRSKIANALFDEDVCDGVCIHSNADGTCSIVMIPKKEAD